MRRHVRARRASSTVGGALALACLLVLSLLGCDSGAAGPSPSAVVTALPTTTTTPTPTTPTVGHGPSPTATGGATPVATQTTGSRGTTHVVREVIRFGTSVRGVPLTVLHVGDPSLPAVLVVGCIHGSERAGIPVARALMRLSSAATSHVNLWIVTYLNPDGAAADTRTNAHGIDLNRNFANRWLPHGHGTTRDSGPSAASEPETRAMQALLQRVQPAVGIWFHQALALIDVSEGPAGAEALIARALRLPERSLPDYRGSAIGFENHLKPRSGFAVELGPGAMALPSVRRVTASIVAIASAANPAAP